MKPDKLRRCTGATTRHCGEPGHCSDPPPHVEQSVTPGRGSFDLSATTEPITANCSKVSVSQLTFALRSSITVRFAARSATPDEGRSVDAGQDLSTHLAMAIRAPVLPALDAGIGTGFDQIEHKRAWRSAFQVRSATIGFSPMPTTWEACTRRTRDGWSKPCCCNRGRSALSPDQNKI